MIRVVLVDDEAVVRAGVAAILSVDRDITVVDEAEDGAAGIDAVRRRRPDVVLLDIRMPGTDGLAALPLLRAAVPGTRVIMLTTFSESDYVSRAVVDGADGFVLKAGAPRELILGVHSVASGGAFFSPSVARWLVGQVDAQALTRHRDAREAVANLSTRRRGVLDLLACGHSNAQIAGDLHLTEGTVKGYVSAILDELGVQNRVQAAILAHEAGLGHGRDLR